MEVGEKDSGLRLAELVAVFSLALDLGMGQPMEHVLRSWVIAARLADELGLDAEQRGSLYYVVSLAWVGCVADTPAVAAWFGDDIGYRADSYQIDMAGLPLLEFVFRHLGSGRPALQRARLAATLVATRGRAIEQGLKSHCLSTAQMAERIGLGLDVCDPLRHVFARWDGRGIPRDVNGEGIALSTRLFHLADVVEVYHREGGTEAAVAVARKRRGTHFDPALVDAFCGVARTVLDDDGAAGDWHPLIAGEPALQRRLSERELDGALEAVADFTDLRSVSRAGHSRGVAELAALAAAHCGLPDAEAVTLRRAGLLHDIGLHGISATILDNPGPLSAAQWERMRMHTYYAERMLSRPPMLARLGAVASLAHERCDGSGYHRGLSGPAIPVTGRLLAAACAYRAMTEPRAHRPAMEPKQATSVLRGEVRAGRLDAAAVEAVLAAAGQWRGKRRSGPAGLTPRELEVLLLIARGASNAQAARTLGITPKTAGTYIERIYTKTGASTRSTATLFAMQHGLLDTLQPLDDL